MQHNDSTRFMFRVVVGLFACLISSALYADPPSRVARLSYTNGAVSFSPAGEETWLNAVTNRPLITGDQLWTPEDARAELQLDGATAWLGSNTNISILNLDDNIVQFKVSQGRFNLYIDSLEPKQIYEIDTPNVAISIDRPGFYLVHVDQNQDFTKVSIQKGRADVYGVESAYRIQANKTYRFYGTDLKEFETLLTRYDAFDKWSLNRVEDSKRVTSRKYISRSVIGYQDLDRYGTWREIPQYGRVWSPSRVASNWAPYRNGHWSWIEPWGWTWIDQEPWGFAPYHYGRWTHYDRRWYWIPAPTRTRAIYAPALVFFLGNRNVSTGFSVRGTRSLAWFPLGPGDIYLPPYQYSRDYFYSINRGNTTVNNVTINNIYNNPVFINNLTYQNQAVENALTAVPVETFVNSQSVEQNKLAVSKKDLESSQVMSQAAVVPEQKSIEGAGTSAEQKPSKEVQNRRVVVKSKTPDEAIPFSKKQEKLAQDPGKPLTTEETESLTEKNPDQEKEFVRADGSKASQNLPESTLDQGKPVISEPSEKLKEKNPGQESEFDLPENRGKSELKTEPAINSEVNTESKKPERGPEARPVLEVPKNSKPAPVELPAEQIQEPSKTRPDDFSKESPTASPSESRPERKPERRIEAPRQVEPPVTSVPEEPQELPKENVRPQLERIPDVPKPRPSESRPERKPERRIEAPRQIAPPVTSAPEQSQELPKESVRPQVERIPEVPKPRPSESRPERKPERQIEAPRQIAPPEMRRPEQVQELPKAKPLDAQPPVERIQPDLPVPVVPIDPTIEPIQ